MHQQKLYIYICIICMIYMYILCLLDKAIQECQANKKKIQLIKKLKLQFYKTNIFNFEFVHYNSNKYIGVLKISKGNRERRKSQFLNLIFAAFLLYYAKHLMIKCVILGSACYMSQFNISYHCQLFVSKLRGKEKYISEIPFGMIRSKYL